MSAKKSDAYESAYEEALLVRNVQDAIIERLAKNDFSRRDLADKLGVSEGRVSQMLSGRPNLTLATMAAVARALGTRFNFDLMPLSIDELSSPYSTSSR